MKKILILSILSISLMACGQKKQIKKDMKTRPIVQLYAHAKKLNYKSEPIYVMMTRIKVVVFMKYMLMIY